MVDEALEQQLLDGLPVHVRVRLEALAKQLLDIDGERRPNEVRQRPSVRPSHHVQDLQASQPQTFVSRRCRQRRLREAFADGHLRGLNVYGPVLLNELERLRHRIGVERPRLENIQATKSITNPASDKPLVLAEPLDSERSLPSAPAGRFLTVRSPTLL